MTLPRLLVPAISTAAMLVVLLGLGTWQVQRLHWKQGLLAQIDAAEARPARQLGDSPQAFAKVSVTGKLRFDLAARYGADVRDTAAGPVSGAQLIVPLERAGSPPLLADLGWVEDHAAPPAARGQGDVVLSGYIRPADHPGWFAAKDDPVGRRFYTLDPAAIGAALGLGTVEPFTLVVLGPPPPGGQTPIPAEHLPRPPNNHLQYAITWYGLAAALVVVFVIYVSKGLAP